MPKSCGATNFMGGKCGNRFGLNKVVFSDPSSEDDEYAWVCLEHSNELIDKFLIDIKGLETQIKTCEERTQMSKRIPDAGLDKTDKLMMLRMNDENGTQLKLKERIFSLKQIKNNALWKLCRYPTCHGSLEGKKIYSITIYSALKKDGSGGRMRKSLYLHHNCWMLAKGMFGIKMPIASGQSMLESLSN